MKEIKQDAAVPGGSCYPDHRRNDYVSTLHLTGRPSESYSYALSASTICTACPPPG